MGENVNPERVGVWIGSGIGGLGEFEEQYKKFLEKGQRRVNPFTIPMFIPDMAAGRVSIELGAKGINNVLSLHVHLEPIRLVMHFVRFKMAMLMLWLLEGQKHPLLK